VRGIPPTPFNRSATQLWSTRHGSRWEPFEQQPKTPLSSAVSAQVIAGILGGAQRRLAPEGVRPSTCAKLPDAKPSFVARLGLESNPCARLDVEDTGTAGFDLPL
jgi:hypothetical protein